MAFQKIGPVSLDFCAPHVHIVAARQVLPPMPSLGVSSLDLGRLWQRRRPLYLPVAKYLPGAKFSADLAFARWHGSPAETSRWAQSSWVDRN
jgi:hypothetical protein